MDRRSVVIGTFLLLVIAATVAFFGLRGDGGANSSTTLAAGPSTNATSVTTENPGPAESVAPPTAAPPSTSESPPPTTEAPASTPDSSAPDTIPTSTTTTTLPAAEDPEAGEEASDPVPLGEAVVHRNWEIGVSQVDLDAGEVVAAMYEANEAPGEGFRYILVELSGTNVGDTHAEPVFDVGLVNGEFRHEFSFDECGQLTSALIDVVPQGPRSHMAANVCFNVAEERVDENLVLTLGFFDEEGERFFALQD